MHKTGLKLVTTRQEDFRWYEKTFTVTFSNSISVSITPNDAFAGENGEYEDDYVEACVFVNWMEEELIVWDETLKPFNFDNHGTASELSPEELSDLLAVAANLPPILAEDAKKQHEQTLNFLSELEELKCYKN